MDDLNAINFALLMMRVCVGLSLAMHGKNHIWGGGKIPGTGRWFTSIGMKHGELNAWLASITEIVAGVGLAFGLLTTLDAAGFVGCLFVAVWTVHRFNGFFIIKEGWEYVTVLMVVSVGIAMIGPGEWSLDHALGIDDKLDGWVALLVGAGGGLLAAATALALFYTKPVKAES